MRPDPEDPTPLLQQARNHTHQPSGDTLQPHTGKSSWQMRGDDPWSGLITGYDERARFQERTGGGTSSTCWSEGEFTPGSWEQLWPVKMRSRQERELVSARKVR